MFIAQRFLFWITSLIAFAHVSQVQAQTYTFEFSLTPLQPAVVTDYVFTPPSSWSDTPQTIGQLTAYGTYTSETFYAQQGYSYANPSGAKLTSFSGPASLSVLPATPANLLDLQMQYAQYGVSTQENLGVPSNFVPVVDTWFTFYLSGNQDVYGNYRGYSGVASADFDMQIDVDPTEGTISYVSPTQSVVSFKKYPSASAQFAFISYGLAIGLNNDPTSPSIEYVSGFNVAADSMPYAGSAALTTFSVSSLIINRVQGTCGDTRDKLIPMYAQYNVLLSPVCSDFTQTASSSTYSFNDLNIHNTYAFALLRYPIIGPQFMGYGLEMLVNLIGTPVHAINSGYRNPDHNADIGGASNSRHMFGDAVDLVNITQTKTEWAQIRNLAIQAGADYVEPFTGPCGNACVHVDWRNTTGLYAP